MLAVLLAGATGCPRAPVAAAPDNAPADARDDRVVISIVGTNDLHGHLGALPLLGGHLANLRRARAADGGAVVLLDGGDMFQGTLESNLEEGAAVVQAYGVLGYDAVAIGNHEFDYGPVGSQSTATSGQDPRGALRARMGEASYPFVAANIVDADTGAPADLGVRAVMIERSGVRIGIVGATTESTPQTTIAANVDDLRFAPVAAAIAAEAHALRRRGAAVVVVAAHIGGKCTDLGDPDVLTSCDPDDEIMHVARALPPGAVDAIVAGHTHQAMAHRVAGVAVIESYANGVAFGRIDLTVDRRAARVVDVAIHPPWRLCRGDASPEGPQAACDPEPYEGAAVSPDPAVAAAIAPALAKAATMRSRPLGPRLTAEFGIARGRESAVGNLITDMMLAARRGHDLALVNGGGLRAPLPEGPLRYGALYETFPFDNRFATVRLPAGELAAMLATMLGRDGSFFSVGGVRVQARCADGALRVVVVRDDGRAIGSDETLAILTSDFLATGGDGLFSAIADREGAVTLEDGPPIREVLADAFTAMPDTALDPSTYLRAAPRVELEGQRPVRCP